MIYTDFCAACTYMKEDSISCNGKYYCYNNNKKDYASNNICYFFHEDSTRDTYSKCYMYANSIMYSEKNNCYVTSAICTILAIKNIDYYLKIIKSFKETILKFDENMETVLLTYDIIGSIIANNLIKDPNSKTIAKVFLEDYIDKLIILFYKGKIQKSLDIYTKMIDKLAFYYNIDIEIIKKITKEINSQKLNHTKTKKKTVIKENTNSLTA